MELIRTPAVRVLSDICSSIHRGIFCEMNNDGNESECKFVNSISKRPVVCKNATTMSSLY